MGDLPPSYEAATGISAAASNFTDIQPTKPSAPPPGQIVATQCTTTIPIPSDTVIASQHLHQPPYPVAPYPTSVPTPQTNVILRNQPSKSGKKTLCVILAIIFSIVIGLLIVALIVIRTSTPKYKPDFNDTFESIYAQPEYPHFDWETFNKNNQDLLERFNNKVNQIPKFDYH